MKLNEVLTKTIQFFKEKKIESARLDAELLVAHALKLSRMALYLKYEQPLTESETQLCRDYLRRRASGEPVAYIVGEKGFFGDVFQVLPGVLVPRPETEHLVETVLDFFKKEQMTAPKILDLGAGTGCIGLSLLRQLPEATLTSVEFSSVAQSNIEMNTQQFELQARVQLIKSKVEEIDLKNFSQFDCVVSNPPYVDIEDPLVDKHVRQFEPATALFAPNKGLSFLENWSKLTVGHLRKPGIMAFEMGFRQGQIMQKHFESFGQFKEIKIIKDLSGHERVIVGVN